MRLLISFATVTAGGPGAGGGVLPQPSSANRPNIERSMVRFSGAFIVLELPGSVSSRSQVTVPPVTVKETIPGGWVLHQRAFFCLFHQPSNRPVDPWAS